MLALSVCLSVSILGLQEKESIHWFTRLVYGVGGSIVSLT